MRTKVMQSLSSPLALVNAAHPIQGEHAPDLVAVDEHHPDILLERRAAGLLNACIQAVDGRGQILPVSGWRSREEQQSIWDETWAKEGEAFTRQYVALPGCSEHETGLAIDLGLAGPDIDFIRPHFPDRGVCAAFKRRAADYGFILRYPAGKEHITGIAHEPWHFRYVGTPHAGIMVRLGLALEEYLDLLHQHPIDRPLCCRVQGRAFRICRIEGGGPDDLAAQEDYSMVSRDNCGGWVLTSWKLEGW